MSRWFDKDLQAIVKSLKGINEQVKLVREQQEEKNECYPENLQSSENFERMEDRVMAFEELEDSIDNLIDDIEEVEWKMKYKVYFKANNIGSDEELKAYIRQLKELQSILKSDIVILDEDNKIIFEMKAEETKKWNVNTQNI